MGSDKQWWRSWWATWGGTILGGLVVEGGGRLLFETGWIAPLFRLLGDLLTFEVRAPVLVLLLSATLLGLVVWLFARWKLVPDPDPLRQKDYTRDLIDGVVWEWSWVWGDVSSLTAICPKCGVEMEERRRRVRGRGYRPYETRLASLQCEPCGDTWKVENDDLKEDVEKEVERRVRTGDWKDVVKELGSKEVPLEVPIRS